MFSKKKPDLDTHQKELFEHAQERVREKKGLYTHFILYLVGCIFMIVLNLLLDFGIDFKPLGIDWFVYGVLFWTFFILVHLFRVLLFSKFMNKAWHAKQMDYLIKKQQKKIAKMEEKLNLKVPKEASNTKTTLLDKTKNYLTDNEITD